MDISTTAAHTRYSGVGISDIAAGKTLKIETSPQGEEILSLAVPAGKKWHAVIVVDIMEEDV